MDTRNWEQTILICLEGGDIVAKEIRFLLRIILFSLLSHSR